MSPVASPSSPVHPPTGGKSIACMQSIPSPSENSDVPGCMSPNTLAHPQVGRKSVKGLQELEQAGLFNRSTSPSEDSDAPGCVSPTLPVHPQTGGKSVESLRVLEHTVNCNRSASPSEDPDGLSCKSPTPSEDVCDLIPVKPAGCKKTTTTESTPKSVKLSNTTGVKKAKPQRTWTKEEKQELGDWFGKIIKDWQVVMGKEIPEEKYEWAADHLEEQGYSRRSKNSIKMYWIRQGRKSAGIDDRKKKKIKGDDGNTIEVERDLVTAVRPSKTKDKDVAEGPKVNAPKSGKAPKKAPTRKATPKKAVPKPSAPKEVTSTKSVSDASTLDMSAPHYGKAPKQLNKVITGRILKPGERRQQGEKTLSVSK